MPDPSDGPRPSMRRPLPLSSIALGLSVLALGVSVAPWLAPYLMGGVIRSYLLSHPEVLVEASRALQAREADAQIQAILDAAQANNSVLQVGPGEAAFGPADARVTVIEYFDFRCPACRAVLPQYMQLMEAHPEVRFVFRDWPILDRGDDQGSTETAMAAVAAHRQGRYLEAYQALMSADDLSPDGIDRALASAGVDVVRARADMAGPEVARRLADVHSGAATLGLSATPTFFVGGQPIVGGDIAGLERAIAAAKRDSGSPATNHEPTQQGAAAATGA